MKTIIYEIFLPVLLIFIFTSFLNAIPVNPYINSVSPDINSLNAGRSQNIVIHFLQDMDPLTLNSTGIKISGNETGLMTIVITYNAATRTAEINPDEDFKTGEQINVNINNSVKTIANVPVDPISYSFTVNVSRGDGNFTMETVQQGGIKPDGIISGDFDGDGAVDLITIDKDSLRGVFLKNNGAGSFTQNNIFIIDTTLVLSYTNADFDNDGDIDLAFIVGTYFDYRLKILLNNGNGTFTNGYRGIVPGRVGTGLLKSADIVNDGYNDILIVFGDRFSGVMEIQKNNGNAEFSNGGSFINARCQDQQPLFGEITSFGLCDVNNDGSIDILLESYSSSFNFAGNGINECHTIQIMTNNGSGAFSEKIAYSFSEDHNIICTGDFDGDGFVDFMCSGLYMKNNGNGFFTSSPADIIAGAGITGDFEADGDLDIAVLDGNSVRLYKNDGHGIFTGPFNFNTGNGPNGICSGNFNGDCALDIATSNSGSKNVSVLFNSGSMSNCIVTGPDMLTVNTLQTMYTSSDNSGFWEINNHPPCNAYITGSTPDTVFVNAGTSPGIFILYHNSQDECGWITCSKAVTVDNPMPVELASFTSVLNKNTVTLQWTTSSEVNNSGFDIERSVSSSQYPNENINWERIGNVSGHGTIATPNNYSFIDRILTTGKYRYRLKQIDFNGNFEYYNLPDEVVIGIPEKYELSQNYPNPFNPTTKIEFSIPEKGFVSLKIYDASGREVASPVNELKTPGYYSVSFSAKDGGVNLSSGIYFYTLNTGDFIATKKMLLVK